MDNEPQWKECYLASERARVTLEDRCRKVEEKCRKVEEERRRGEEERRKLEGRCAGLLAENQKRKEKLGTTSRNSPKPPSQDVFRKSRSVGPTGRKQGGQLGHVGHKRYMYPDDQVTKTVDRKPDICPTCRQAGRTEESVHTHQVAELRVARAIQTFSDIVDLLEGKGSGADQ